MDLSAPIRNLTPVRSGGLQRRYWDDQIIRREVAPLPGEYAMTRFFFRLFAALCVLCFLAPQLTPSVGPIATLSLILAALSMMIFGKGRHRCEP